MNNSTVVSEKEIIKVIEMLEDTISGIRDNCEKLVRSTNRLENDVLNVKNQWNTTSSSELIHDMDHCIVSMMDKEKKMFKDSNSMVVDVNYTTIQDESVRGGISG